MLNFLDCSRVDCRLQNRLRGEKLPVDDSGTHDDHVTNSKVQNAAINPIFRILFYCPVEKFRRFHKQVRDFTLNMLVSQSPTNQVGS